MAGITDVMELKLHLWVKVKSFRVLVTVALKLCTGSNFSRGTSLWVGRDFVFES